MADTNYVWEVQTLFEILACSLCDGFRANVHIKNTRKTRVSFIAYLFENVFIDPSANLTVKLHKFNVGTTFFCLKKFVKLVSIET